MRVRVRNYLFLTIVLTLASCGLKGQPMPPPETKGTPPPARSGAGALQFGPREKKEAPEEELILKLYGPQGAPKSRLPRVEDSFGTGALGVTKKPPETWLERQTEIEEEVTLPPEIEEAPRAVPTDDDSEK